MKTFVKVAGRDITRQGKKIQLKGVNLGGWLMMEGYILHARNIAEQVFKKDFSARLGARALAEFERHFYGVFIQEGDFKNIAAAGFNCLRVPFNHRLIEDKPFHYRREGLKYLDAAARWGKKYGLGIILDLHAAAGCQNCDWHADSLGQAELWTKKSNQDRTYALWAFLADHFKDNEAVWGYDILNEPVLDDALLLNQFYARLIKTIRAVDKQHIIFVEGNKWANDIACLDNFPDKNIALSVHVYQPLEFTFNFIPRLRYPVKGPSGIFDKNSMKHIVAEHVRVAHQRQRPVLVGEFGINVRDGYYGEDRWLKDTLDCFAQAEFHWTYWTYKAVKNAVFPDGILSYDPNPPWVRREGPKLGWENYADLWPKRKKDIISSWGSEHFTENETIINTFRPYLKGSA